MLCFNFWHLWVYVLAAILKAKKDMQKQATAFERQPFKKATILRINLFAGTSAVRGRTGSEPSEAEVAAVCQQEH